MEEQENTTQNKKRNALSFLFFKVPFIVVVAVLLALGALGYFAVKQNPQVLGMLGLETGSQVEAEVAALIEEVSRLIELPADEAPTIATVTDAELIREQPFFRNAQNGDRVFIYPNNRKVILYRESNKRIIEVGVVSISEETGEENIELDDEEAETPASTPTAESEEVLEEE